MNNEPQSNMGNDDAGEPIVKCKKPELVFDFVVDDKEIEHTFEIDDSEDDVAEKKD